MLAIFSQCMNLYTSNLNNWQALRRCLQNEVTLHISNCSSQYQLGNAILKLNSTPSTAATIGDLGWLPKSYHILWLGYYRHLLQLPDERLPKLVYKELLNLNDKNTMAFKYPQHIKDILADKGMGHMFNDIDALHVCVQTFKCLTNMCYNERFNAEIMARSSLIYYSSVKENTQMSQYLQSNAPLKPLNLS